MSHTSPAQQQQPHDDEPLPLDASTRFWRDEALGASLYEGIRSTRSRRTLTARTVVAANRLSCQAISRPGDRPALSRVGC